MCACVAGCLAGSTRLLALRVSMMQITKITTTITASTFASPLLGLAAFRLLLICCRCRCHGCCVIFSKPQTHGYSLTNVEWLATSSLHTNTHTHKLRSDCICAPANGVSLVSAFARAVTLLLVLAGNQLPVNVLVYSVCVCVKSCSLAVLMFDLSIFIFNLIECKFIQILLFYILVYFCFHCCWCVFCASFCIHHHCSWQR